MALASSTTASFSPYCATDLVGFCPMYTLAMSSSVMGFPLRTSRGRLLIWFRFWNLDVILVRRFRPSAPSTFPVGASRFAFLSACRDLLVRESF